MRGVKYRACTVAGFLFQTLGARGGCPCEVEIAVGFCFVVIAPINDVAPVTFHILHRHGTLRGSSLWDVAINVVKGGAVESERPALLLGRGVHALSVKFSGRFAAVAKSMCIREGFDVS